MVKTQIPNLLYVLTSQRLVSKNVYKHYNDVTFSLFILLTCLLIVLYLFQVKDKHVDNFITSTENTDYE